MLPYSWFEKNETLKNWYLETYWDWYRKSWISDVVAYIHNRFRDKIHTVQLKALKKGKYYDTDVRMFEAVFQLLVDFVETESSVKDLEWAATLDDSSLPEHERNESQAAHARKTLELYRWYKLERANRPDPYAIKGDYKARYAESERQEEEDTQKAQEVLAIRRGLWT
jgi:hypothetical protein